MRATAADVVFAFCEASKEVLDVKAYDLFGICSHYVSSEFLTCEVTALHPLAGISRFVFSLTVSGNASTFFLLCVVKNF